MLICGDWLISFKTVFVSAAALYTALPGKQLFFNTPKVAPSGKEWICIFIQVCSAVHTQLVCLQYANVSCWRQFKTAWDSF